MKKLAAGNWKMNGNRVALAEVSALIDHALSWPCVRGVTFQPIQDAGRNEGFDANENRTLLSDIRRAVIAGANPFMASDMIPLPCNPESICIGYGLRQGSSLVPITGLLPRDTLIDALTSLGLLTATRPT